jgi:deazaflavin-dependent oxidoreductase (nitroreductase family)
VKRVGAVAFGAALAFAALAAVFMIGMRQKSPLVLNAVRRSGRAMRPYLLKSSGKPGAVASIIRHVGRKSGQTYETPVNAVPTDDGFVIALPYGLNTDWLKNVLASGSATIVDEGSTYPVDHPAIVPLSVAEPLFPPKDQRTHRRFRVEDYLVVRRVV